MKNYINIFFSIIFCFLTACKKDNRFDCLKSTGKLIKEERTFSTYNRIYIKDNINIVFTSDTSQKITVEAGEHIIHNIKTEVINNELTISNENKCNWVRSYKKLITIYISQGLINEITNWSYEDVTTNGTWNSNQLIIHQYGNGKMELNVSLNNLIVDMNHFSSIKLSGNAVNFEGYTLGLGTLDSRDLKCKICSITAEGQNDSYVYSDSLLYAKIQDQGNIYYSGNPLITLEDIGKGNLIKE